MSRSSPSMLSPRVESAYVGSVQGPPRIIGAEARDGPVATALCIGAATPCLARDVAAGCFLTGCRRLRVAAAASNGTSDRRIARAKKRDTTRVRQNRDFITQFTCRAVAEGALFSIRPAGAAGQSNF